MWYIPGGIVFMPLTTRSDAFSPGDLSFAQYYIDMQTPLPSKKLQAGS